MLFNNLPKHVKGGIMILLFILAVLFLLDFVPVKFAQIVGSPYNENRIVDDLNHIDIIATYSKKTGDFEYPWEAYFKQDSEISIIRFKVIGNIPYDILNRKDFYHNNTEWKIDISFMLKGELQIINETECTGEFNISSWEMVNPIRRNSLRKYYAPKTYLTIYDFDWIAVIKKLIK